MAVSIRDIFLEAHGRDGPARADYLDRVCGDNTALRAEVQRLLAAADGADDYCDRLADRLKVEISGGAEPAAERMPAQLGAYRPLELIGRGGMGTVYLAERTDEQYEKQVAIKVLPAAVGAQAAERFVRERQILAGLVHPNIARLLDGGLSDDDRPYFVMDFIDGLPIDEYCDQYRLTVEQRLKVFFQALSAVQYAHSQLVLHRDLKPSNILVDRSGFVHLLDFGVGELLGVTPAGDDDRQLALTPSHASPELLRGHGASTASDVYSLGVVLYRLLTGTHPLELNGLSLAQLLTKVQSAAVPLASERVLAGDVLAAQARQLTQRRLARRLRGDLDAIAERALKRDPGERYQSVGQLSADLSAYLEHQPVSAVADSTGYRLRRFVRRYRLPVTLSALLLIVTASLAIVATRFALNTRAQAEVVAAERDRAEAVSDFLLSLFAYANPRRNEKGAAITAKELVDLGVARIRRLDHQPDTQAALLDLAANVYSHMDELEPARELFEQALAMARQDPEITRRGLARSLTRLARVEADLGDWAATERNVREAIELSEAIDDHGDVAREYLLLGSIRLTQGDFSAAESALNQALQAARSETTRNPMLIARILSHLGQAAAELHQLQRAESLHRQALELRTRPDLKGSLDEGTSYLELGQVQLARGELAAATASVDAANVIFERLLFTNSIPRAEVARTRAEIALAMGSLTQAAGLAEQAVATWRRIGVKHHPERARALTTLAAVYAAANQMEPARVLLQQALEISGQLQPNHSRTGQLRHWLQEMAQPDPVK
ncbi:MAG: serine/threonine-protein kinase [Xanthomonadales bacterium]|nr:serine/threonine-protein kinase [Xanthomonadales bacterium]